MRLAMILPGGVDPSGTHRVIPCLLWLMERIGRVHELHVFPMRGEPSESPYDLRGARVYSPVVGGHALLPGLRNLLREHRREPFSLFHAFWASGPGVLAALAGVLARRPVALHLPGGDLVAKEGIGYGGLSTPTERARVIMALRRADRVTGSSTEICQAAGRFGVSAERIPLGVCRREWPPRGPRERQPGTPARLVHVGSLNRVKDQETLLRAVRKLADAGLDLSLDLVGEDTLGGEVQRLAARMGLESKTCFHGFVPQDGVREIVSAAHLMLLSSLHEAGPVAVAEAARVGVPTVGTAVGILKEWAPAAASVVPVGDHSALADATLALLSNEDRRQSMARAALDRTLEEDADWTACRFLDLYETLTG